MVILDIFITFRIAKNCVCAQKSLNFQRISYTNSSSFLLVQVCTYKKTENPLVMRLSGHFSIFVCTTFAWFTSQDEVTNRLSASADYGVSIVESFAPPAEWLPGQEVNKDVYATNTGNVTAMVKEEVNGRLAITYEVDEKDFSDGCVKLTEEERYAVEAGSFLAYKPSDSVAVIGNQIVTRPGDQTVPVSTDFEPDKEGLYVFRRYIKVNADDKSEEFTYDGYYFKDGEYYKVSNIQTYQDSHVADKSGAGTMDDPYIWSFNDYMGDGINDDGVLMVASATFRKEKTDYVDPVDLVYKKGYVTTNS